MFAEASVGERIAFLMNLYCVACPGFEDGILWRRDARVELSSSELSGWRG